MGISIVSVDALRREIADGEHGCTVVDARPRGHFLEGHIPGAVSLEWEEWCGAPPRGADPVLSQPGYWGTLADAGPAWYADGFARDGITSEQPIVVYADGVASKGREGRVAWMLLYLGAADVRLLDSGWTAWLEQHGAIATWSAPPRPGRFAIERPRSGRRCTHAQLAQAYRAGSLPILVDTRTPAEFEGDCYDYLPRKGRLPDALLFPFDDLFDGSHHYVGRETYLARLPDGMRGGSRANGDGAGPGQGLVMYCEVGVRASLTALLHETYTGEVTGVFDGSLIEWALHADLPVLGPVYPLAPQ